ncbi:MAG TPA: hypothetical protein VFT29_19870 [Gemmatimonadaceae bacterium]|nr:hypothetical protein [Gemmatimonadaceae bacterium]
MSERRFNETEVAEIFQRAAETQVSGRRQLKSGDGMTLGELQAIGQEVGLSPELIAEAAVSIDRVGRPTSRRFLGLPIGVGRTVDLNRRLSDAEWERLVVDLRETFDARGTMREEGSFRQWTNGNLQALLEPTESGHRLRLRTVKGNSVSLIVAGVGMLGMSAALLVAAALKGSVFDPGAISSMGLLATMGLGMFGIGALRLPGWARTRRRQMEEVAARLATPTPTTEG